MTLATDVAYYVAAWGGIGIFLETLGVLRRVPPSVCRLMTKISETGWELPVR
jgi:hypothetical protein